MQARDVEDGRDRLNPSTEGTDELSYGAVDGELGRRQGLARTDQRANVTECSRAHFGSPLLLEPVDVDAVRPALTIAKLDDEKTESSAALAARARESESNVAVRRGGEPVAEASVSNRSVEVSEDDVPLEAIEDVGGSRLGRVGRINRLRNGLRERDV